MISSAMFVAWSPIRSRFRAIRIVDKPRSIVAGELGRNPKSLPPMLDLAEALGAAVVDSDGRYAFPSTHPLNLTTAREDALQNADVVLALDVPSLGVPLGPTVREPMPVTPKRR